MYAISDHKGVSMQPHPLSRVDVSCYRWLFELYKVRQHGCLTICNKQTPFSPPIRVKSVEASLWRLGPGEIEVKDLHMGSTMSFLVTNRGRPSMHCTFKSLKLNRWQQESQQGLVGTLLGLLPQSFQSHNQNCLFAVTKFAPGRKIHTKLIDPLPSQSTAGTRG